MYGTSLEQHQIVRNLISDLAWKYGQFLVTGDVPEAAKPTLAELAHFADRDIAWAVTEVAEEYDYIQSGGYL